MSDTLQYVIGIILIAGMVFGLVDWRSIFEKVFGNDERKARIYMDVGGTYKKIKAKRIDYTDLGATYQFKIGKETKQVILTKDYPEKYCDGRRVILMELGQGTAKLTLGNNESPTVGLNEISLLTLGKFANDFGKAFTTQSSLSWKWFILIGVIVIAGYFIYQQFLGGNAPVNNVTGGSSPIG